MQEQVDRWSAGKQDIWVFVLLLVVVIFVFKGVIAGTHEPFMSSLKEYEPWESELTSDELARPESFAHDPTTQTYPWAVYAHENLQNGDFPLWNKGMFSGTPFVANRLTGLFDPLILIPVWIFKPMTGLSIFYFLHYFLAAWFMYLFLKALGLSRTAAVFGALAYILQGAYVPWMGFIVADKCYLPMSLYYLERTSERRDRAGIIGFVISFVLLTITSYPQMMVFAFYIFFAWILFAKGNNVKNALRRGAALLILLVVIFLLGAMQHVPTAEFFQNSLRAHAEFRQELFSKTNLEQYDSPLTLLAIYFPTFFGDYILDELPGRTRFIVGIYNHAYIGFLAAFGFLFAPLVWRNAKARFFIVLAIIGLVFIAWHDFYMVAVRIIPGLRISTVKPNFITLTFMIIASSFVLDHFLKRLKTDEEFTKKFTRVYGWLLGAVIGIGVVLIFAKFAPGFFDPEGAVRLRGIFGHFIILWIAAAFFYFYMRGKIGIKILHTALICLLLIDLVPYQSHFMPLVPKGKVCFETPTSEFLVEQAEQDGPFRIFRDRKQVFPPNTAMVYGIDEIGGFDSFVSSDYSFFFRAVDPPDPNDDEKRVMSTNSRTLDLPSDYEHYRQPFWAFLGVRYLLSPEPMENLESPWKLARVGNLNIGWVPEWRFLRDLKETVRGSVYFYENEEWLPRWYVVPEIIPVETVEQGYNASMWIDPSKEAVVVGIEHADIPPSLLSGSEQTWRDTGNVEVLKYGADDVELSVECESDCLLVFSDTYFPGWKAWVDGEMVEIYRTNGIIKGIILWEGSHTVKFLYNPVSYKIGWTLFLVGLVLLPFIIRPIQRLFTPE